MNADAHIAVHENHALGRVVAIEALADARDEHNGIFKPFAAVNRDDAHDVIIFAERGGSRHVAFDVANFLEILNELRQPVSIRRLEVGGAVD